MSAPQNVRLTESLRPGDSTETLPVVAGFLVAATVATGNRLLLLIHLVTGGLLGCYRGGLRGQGGLVDLGEEGVDEAECAVALAALKLRRAAR